MQTWTFGKTDAYPPGPWKDEPDKVQWIDEATNLDCLIVRGPLGALCGYVGMPPDHFLHGLDYNAPDVDVHGGLTYANSCMENDPDSICHIPEEGRPADVWWFGFDCSHAGDLVPSMQFTFSYGPEYYRDMEYVKAEVTKLAAHLAKPNPAH